ncbi:MAG: hypothetical protein K8S00_12200 [Bacteroidales bacterium]|nr:hypothetical protein [Bacteroidales bacterium]
MIKIQVNNKTLYLEPKTTLRFELISKLFDDQVIPLSVVYPFNIPAAANQTVFEFANHVEISRSVKSYACEFYFGGYLLFSGLLYVKNFNSKYYRCSIVVNSFTEGFTDKLLDEFDYGGDIQIGGNPHHPTNVAWHANQIVKGLISANYTFPLIFAPEFYGSLDSNNKNEYNQDWGGDAGGGDVGKYLNNYSRTGNTFPVNQVHQDPECDNVYAMLPCPYLKYVLERIFFSEKYSLFGDFIKDTELQKLILFNNRTLDEKYKKYFVKASMTGQQNISIPTKILFQDDSTGDNEDENNRWNTATSIYTVAYTGYHETKINIRCKSTLSYTDVEVHFALTKVGLTPPYIDQIVDTIFFTCDNYQTWYEFDVPFRSYFNAGDQFYIQVSFIRDAVPPQTSGRIEDGVLSVYNSSYQNLNQFSNILNLKNHVIPVTAGALINNLAKTFGLAVFINTITKEIEFTFKKDILLSTKILDLTEALISESTQIEPATDEGFLFLLKFDDEFADYSNYDFIGNFAKFDDLPTPTEVNKIAIIDNLNVAFIFAKNEDTNTLSWLYFADVFYKQTTGDGSTEVAPDISTLTMHKGEEFISPQFLNIGSSPAFETGKNDIDLILMFYRGMHEDDNNNDYPLASCTRFDNNGNSIGNYEIINRDLFQKFLQPWYDFLVNSETVKMKLDCDLSNLVDIIKLFSAQRTTAARKVRVGNINYIPKKLSFLLSMNGIKETEATLVK